MSSLRLGLPLLAAALVVAASCKPSPPPSKNALANTETWCPEGFEAGPQDTCFALPDVHDGKTPVLVYLHGMYEGHGSPDEWSAVLEASRRGFAVVLPRGRRGYCAWKAELKDHFCWPTEVDDPEPFRAVVKSWDKVLWQVDALLEGGPHKRYVLGFSNGGFFAEYIAAKGLFLADGWAVVNGGSLLRPEKQTKPPAMMLIAADEDPSQGPKMRGLHDELAHAGWTHAFCTRAGGHPITADDVDAALRFFKRDAEGTLKAQAGLYACEGATRPGVVTTAAAVGRDAGARR